MRPARQSISRYVTFSGVFDLRGFDLHGWQNDALAAWIAGDDGGPHRGTLEIFTGGGKTLIALSAIARIFETEPNLRVAIVAPTQALVRQWIESVRQYLVTDTRIVGQLGAGKSDSFDSKRVIVSVINSAAEKLPTMAAALEFPLMLIIDECHRAGAPKFRKVLLTNSSFTLGLSATPERDELSGEGEPLQYDEQVVASALGKIVYRFGLKQAREIGWLPHFEIHHHGVALSTPERMKYEELTRQIDDIKQRLEGLGQQVRMARQLAARQDDIGIIARSYIAVTAGRKDLLYRAASRNVVARQLVRDAFNQSPSRRIILFHERVVESENLYNDIRTFVPPNEVVLEHGERKDLDRQLSLKRFRDGSARVLVSVKSLVEGISVASSSSVRQRIQSLGRVLRRSFDPKSPEKNALMHVIYVTQTVDELIYAKEDWADITGPANNFYWRWLGEERSEEPGPPREPKPSEDTIWASLGETLPPLPFEWVGMLDGLEYSIDTQGNVRNASGFSVDDSLGTPGMVQLVRGRAGGRFRVTPRYNLVLVSRHGPEETMWYLAGRLERPFTAVDPTNVETSSEDPDREYSPGDVYFGKRDATRGTFMLRQKSGGVIEKKRGRDVERASTDQQDTSPQAENARNVLNQWRRLGLQGMKFFVNEDDVAWYSEGNQAKFLANVPSGLSWPSAPSEDKRDE
jgi:superfamily II DNA or RNA helicase